MLAEMRIFWLTLLILVTFIDGKGLFQFKADTLEKFNGARRLLGSGALRTIVDVVNGKLPKLRIPKIGPASNMYKLKWSAKLEHKAWLYGKDRSLLPDLTVESFEYDGLVGFQWPGLLIEIAEKLVDQFVPIPALKDILISFLNMLESFIIAILIASKYPHTLPVTDENLGAAEVLFAHRYEVGCYTKLFFAFCFMEPSRNNGWLYQHGVPCSNCSTHCEFFEDENGFIEEGDLCVPPKEESNTTSALVVKQEKLVSGAHNLFISFIIIFNTFIGYLYLIN